jgi:hypothetical protein
VIRDLWEKKSREGIYTRLGSSRRALARNPHNASLQDCRLRRCVLSLIPPAPLTPDGSQPAVSANPRSRPDSSTTPSSPTTTPRSKVRLRCPLPDGGADDASEVYECSSQVDGTNCSVRLLEETSALTDPRPPARNSRHSRRRPVPHTEREIYQGAFPSHHRRT